MAHHSSALESIPPLYGDSGWVENSGLVKILWPLTDTQVTSDFFRFSGLDRPQIEKIRPLLPADNLQDRQNNAPPLELFFTAALRNPRVSLGGYLVLAPRWDERMSIDSLFIEDKSALNYRESPWALIYEDGIWEKLQEELGFDGYCRPDEYEPITCFDETRGPGWWLWWD